ncbi:MAG: PadR family transcriptional regulator [Gemmatimonadaceae bacterium]
MCGRRDDWGFGPGFPFGGAWRGAWGGAWGGAGPRGGRRRQQMFESGEMKFVILRLLKEKPRHGYEVIRALEEKLGGVYTPSAGTVYPTLQLLEDEGYVRVVETDGKKVYHVTPEGERYLEEHGDLLDEILDRVRETVRQFTGGGVGEVQEAFARLAGITFKRAWRRGPDDPALKRVAEILRKAAEEIEQALQPTSL